MMGRWGKRCKQLWDDIKGNERILEIKREITRLHCVENLLWKRLCSCRKADYGMNVIKSWNDAVWRSCYIVSVAPLSFTKSCAVVGG